ncbi:MAG TPA: TonB-dependent receptor [Pyrinomonadaceae bacterium]|nr:TonB-dependent receptor [Pyrinomonadaceae bacterium]
MSVRQHTQSRASRLGLGFCFILLSLFASTAFGQDITSGAIQGVITDEQGAVVPGALVEAKNTATNFTRNFTTDSDGHFVILSLPPGRYVVTVTKSGFAKLNQENIELTVGRLVSLEIKLTVSGVSGEVTVTGAPTIDTAKTESSTTLNEKAIESTPVLGRKFEDLLTLTPGVSIVQGPDGDEINFAGQRGIFNNVSLDGGDYNNGFFGEQAGGQRAAIDISMEAVKEFQVIATGSNAEYGRTAGGIINVITKSGTNDFHGSAFYYQRLEALTSDTSDGTSPEDFHREQFGGTIGGPIKKDKAFFFIAYEQIFENLLRRNLGEQIGDTPCPVAAPTVPANEALINGNPECQRVALLNFFQTRLGQDEGLPVQRKVNNTAILGKLDWDLNQKNKLSASYNFNYSKNTNQTFDVPTYGTSSNGTEGPSKINVINANLYSTFTTNILNEAHFTYSREERPRAATESNLLADTAMGFGTTFRFGNPFFLQPGVDETFWRTQIRDHVSIISGRHNIKLGGEWLHSANSQVFRGFFTGKYIFDSVSGFLRYSSPAAAGGFGPQTVGCSNGTYVTAPATCPVGTTTTGGPLLLYLQGAGPSGPATDAAGFSDITNEDFALFIQDRWQIWQNFTLNFGIRWEAQMFPDPVVAPSATAYGIFLNDPRFPSDGTLPSDTAMWQPRIGFAWDVMKNGKSLIRASAGIYNARQNMLTQVGSITTNGVQQQTIFVSTDLIRQGFATAPTWPSLVTPTASSCTAGPVTNPFPCFSGVRVFNRDYENPDIYTFNVAYEQEVAPNWALYFDYTHSTGRHLTRFLDYGSSTNSVTNAPFAPFLGETMVASSVGNSAYDGFTVGVRKRFSQGFQLEANYVLAQDKDDDSNERDPFNDRAFDIDRLDLDYSLSDRDIRHKFNFYASFDLPWKIQFMPRIQARSAQPATPLAFNGTNRNSLRKDNDYFSFDWRLARPFKLTETVELIPQFEMFNTFNNSNFVNALWTPGNDAPSTNAPSLFNFDGFLRQGFGDPRTMQLSVRLTF